MFGPTLRGEKCTLRPPRREEAPTCIDWFADPEVFRYTLQVGPTSLSQEEDLSKRRAEERNAIDWVIRKAGYRASGIQREASESSPLPATRSAGRSRRGLGSVRVTCSWLVVVCPVKRG